MYQLVSKLKILKVEFKKLNVRKYQNLENRVAEKLKVLTDLQEKMLNNPSDRGLNAEITNAQDEYITLQGLWASQLQQQAKVDWLEVGMVAAGYFQQYESKVKKEPNATFDNS